MDGDSAVGSRVRTLVSGVRVGKFVSVGVVGAACDTAVLVVLTEGLGVLPEVGTLAGIETAILVMFLLNERWTFADQGDADRGSVFARLERSHVVRAGGVATQFLVFVLLYRVFFVPVALGDLGVWRALAAALGADGLLAGLDLWLLVSKGSGIAVGMVVNYVFESLFTWQVHLE
jgi:putative flippase GtrA